jgi:hypothetical protein
MDSHTLAYLAGVMDSDGWFTIRRDEAREWPGSYSHSENIGCGQTSEAAVSLLSENFGGKITLRSRKGREDSWQPVHYWWLGNRRAADCVRALRPYLRIKGAQADLLLALRASKDLPYSVQRSVVNGRGRGMDPAITAERDELWTRVRSMNERRVRSQG